MGEDEPTDSWAIYEDVNCEYHLMTYSRYGCPQECLSTNGKVCSNTGVCAYDPSAQSALCLCNEGHSGKYCGSTGSSSSSGVSTATTALVFVVLLVVALVAVMGYMYYKLR